MKKIVLAMAAAFLMTAGAMAQDSERGGRPERRQWSQTEMIQHRTDAMVQKYGLSEEQAAKLLTVNTKFAEKLPRGFNGNGLRRPGMRPGRGPQDRVDSLRPNRRPEMRMPNDSAQQARPRRDGRPRVDFEQMRKSMEEYNAELKGIMTSEQYESYLSDQKQMMQRQPNRGNRQHREND